ncbi:TPA: hypothetical protein NG573_004600 [Vibrio parahaemolyticus]|uniref:hypothetical protein n=1 Tax=Vibrio parahaemolyticus TaxID=670 RepID=UPI001E494F61|nr:hypothetical protein [Vibrio parahaemolyticus]HCE3221178.1 hypothetical protein [Vibrio parahaemolyticus]HCG8217533.1 hypothetical protein [Vibrio parahaemolyticus]HCM0852211.1 hypothetical protein [Vibrio parahaemolyticus]HCM1502836.1 hypothetical protein [Vibrio parahaemolyticus]
MANYKNLVDAIDKILVKPRTGQILKINRKTSDKAFEVYVFSLVVKAVKKAGGKVEIRGINTGPNPKQLVFRGSPGLMSSTTQDFTYASCQLNKKQFEIHVGVQYLGTSGAQHELDVSIFDTDRADTIRKLKVLPDNRSLRGGIECKLYDSDLGVSLGRTFVGLVSDLGSLTSKSFVSNGSHAGLADFFSKSGRPDPFFRLSPLNQEVEERFVRHLEQEFRKWCSVPS